MSKRSNSPDAGRRNFLRGATLAGAAALATPVAANTQISGVLRPRSKAASPGPKLASVETMPPSKDPITQTTSGGDFMVDVFKGPHRHLGRGASAADSAILRTLLQRHQNAPVIG
jgi:acetolactate synthase I/II/III large subunit